MSDPNEPAVCRVLRIRLPGEGWVMPDVAQMDHAELLFWAGGDGVEVEHPTREGAIEAWRKKKEEST